MGIQFIIRMSIDYFWLNDYRIDLNLNCTTWTALNVNFWMFLVIGVFTTCTTVSVYWNGHNKMDPALVSSVLNPPSLILYLSFSPYSLIPLFCLGLCPCLYLGLGLDPGISHPVEEKRESSPWLPENLMDPWERESKGERERKGTSAVSGERECCKEYSSGRK